MEIKKASKKNQDLLVPLRQWDMNPFNLWNRMDSMFDDLRKDFFRPNPMRWHHLQHPMRMVQGSVSAPYMDVEEENENYKVTMDLPGIPKDRVEINISRDLLEVKATVEDCSEDEDKERNYIYRERCYQSFKRRVSFEKEVNADEAKADLKDGILVITLPKLVADSKQVRKLELK